MDLTCTGKYDQLARNGLGGNVDAPCANNLGIQLYCNAPDVDAWSAKSWELFNRVRREWNDAIQRVEIPPEVRNYVEGLEKDYCHADETGKCVTFLLPESSWWDVNHNAQAAAIHASWCSRAACALELLDKIREFQGPTESGQENSDVLDEVGDGLGGLADGLGGLAGGAGDALGGLGKGLSLLPIAVVSTAAIALIGTVVWTRRPQPVSNTPR